MSIDNFIKRHNGPAGKDLYKMLERIGVKSLDELLDLTIPADIRYKEELHLPSRMTEYEYLKHIKNVAQKNKVFKTYIGLGYYNTITPSVIQRNILENPSWYTSYTPYQPEISQGRLEALLNFQTMLTELTGMEIANASLLDEGTAAAEAVSMLYNARSIQMEKKGANKFFIDENVFPQTIGVVQTRTKIFDIDVCIGSYKDFQLSENVFGALVQYPSADGNINDYHGFAERLHENGSGLIVAADLLSLTLLSSPGEWGADIVIGSSQRFGVPMGYGGPHAGFFATKEKYKRHIPGRIIGVSKDKEGHYALRMALQTREQHIRREKATSNICTAQSLLAIMAGMFAVYHGPEGLGKIAKRIHNLAGLLARQLDKLGFKQLNKNYFDTIKVQLPGGDIDSAIIEKIALERDINLRYIDKTTIGISLDETTTIDDINTLAEVFAVAKIKRFEKVYEETGEIFFNQELARRSTFMLQPVFHKYRTETEMMRYMKKLERKDFSLTSSMIPLGSCTMKLNAATEMVPISWPEFAEIHPFVPLPQVEGYHEIIHGLGYFLKKITGFDEVSFQPNSGANGEFTGLLVIKAYHESRGEGKRNVALIPSSAHGTNPASAVMAGMKVVIVECDESGNVNIDDLREKTKTYRDHLAVFMITYPSTHGVFEESVKEMSHIVHENGGQVYMDGANMNAQVGFTSPKEIGADVCHLNLHKTFAIPHGGGGPGMGPICVADHLIEFLPSHPVIETGGSKGAFSVSSAPWGSASILVISYGYCRLLGLEGLKEATKMAILNANYLASSLKEYYPVLFKGGKGFVAHEMILDCRSYKQSAGITETDIAKRLIDYGFHAPTLSFPVHGTLMVEPTESESLDELNRFIDAMICIYNEIKEVKDKIADRDDNVLKNAPHTAHATASDSWNHSYSREKAAFPLEWIRENKFWPAVGRLDEAYGDRNLICTCEPISDYRDSTNPVGAI